MASTICGWCGDRTHMTMVLDPYRLPEETWERTTYGSPDSDHPVFMSAFMCANERCRRLSIGWASLFKPSAGQPKEKLPKATLEWEPRQMRRPSYPDVPQQIGEAASEAHACLSVQAHRGAVALARAVVEATAKDQGITRGPLVAKIDEMHEQGLIREITRQLAHEIREGGNEIAHGDLGDEPMPQEDAEAIITLMDQILEEVYQGPARMQALKRSRLEREQRNAAAKDAAENRS